MKTSIVAFLAFACIIGASMAQFNYGLQNSNSGFSSILGLLLLLIIFPLFTSSSSGNNGDTTIIFGNLSGPTGGK